jgi:hypothetical protein
LYLEVRRVEVRSHIQIAPASGSHLEMAVDSTLRDVSRQGATLLHATAIPVETRLALYLGGEADPIRALAVVTGSKGFADGSALVSVQFTAFVDPKARMADPSENGDGCSSGPYATAA